MKFFSYLALVGAVTAIQLAQSNQEKLANQIYLDSMSTEADPAPGYDTNAYPYVATKWSKDKPHPGYQAGHDDFEGTEGLGPYDRQTPANFQGPGSGDDQFMNSMINNYALEESTDTGKPTGNFIFKYNNARMAAWEILDTHLGLKGKAAEDYMANYFDKTWKHFDTAADGKIEAARMSGFFRFLCGNMNITLH